MDNRGQTPNESANTEPQSPKPRMAKGHSEPNGIIRTAELGSMGGGSTDIHGDAGNWSKKGHNTPLYVSNADMLSSQMELGNEEYMAEMLAEQRENQDRNEMSRRDNGRVNPTDTSDKTA